MNFVKAFFQFYVYSNMHVSFAVYCLTKITGICFKTNVQTEAFFLALATFLAYHVIRYFNRFKYGKIHLLAAYSNQFKLLFWGMNGVAFLGLLLLVVYYNLLQWIRLFPFVIVTLLYAFSFLKIGEKRYSIRYLPGIKIFIIAIVWAGVVVFFPLPITAFTFLYFVKLVLFVVALTLPFDIRDIVFDKGSVKTIPMVLGLQKSKLLGFFLILASIGIHACLFKTDGLWEYVLTTILLLLLLWKSSVQQSKYYASFWVEGIPVFYYLLLLL